MRRNPLLLVFVWALGFGVSGPLFAKDYFLDGLLSPKPVLFIKKQGTGTGNGTSGCNIQLYAPLLAESSDDTPKINDLIRGHVAAHTKRLKLNCKNYLSAWLAYDVTRADNFTSINLVLYRRQRGGAHGAFDSLPITIDVKLKQIEPLKALFTSANYLSIVNDLLSNVVLPALAAKGQEYDFKPITAHQRFYLTEHDLVICYEPYEVASGAAGIVEIPIALPILRKHLNPELAADTR